MSDTDAMQAERPDEASSSKTDEDVPAIVHIDLRLLKQPEVIMHIYADKVHHYYASQDWSPEFYVTQACLGFVAVAFGDYLLPELQRQYCVMVLRPAHGHAADRLQVHRKVRRRVTRKRSYTLCVDRDLAGVLRGVAHAQGPRCWVTPEYQALAHALVRDQPTTATNFAFHSVELYDGAALVAGEIGYSIGATYTSLTGFFSHEKVPGTDKLLHDGAGAIQLAALGALLRRQGYALWNLGHPPRGDRMVYKTEMGGCVVPREEFLQLWLSATQSAPVGGRVGCGLGDIDVCQLVLGSTGAAPG